MIATTHNFTYSIKSINQLFLQAAFVSAEIDFNMQLQNYNTK